jgi:hypothetical protein
VSTLDQDISTGQQKINFSTPGQTLEDGKHKSVSRMCPCAWIDGQTLEDGLLQVKTPGLLANTTGKPKSASAKKDIECFHRTLGE